MEAATTKRLLLFVFGCMAARFGLAYLAYRYRHAEHMPLMGLAALVIAGGFAVIYVGGLRRTGPEVFGGRIWWDALRPVHASLFFLFALMALARDPRAWTVLAADAGIGAGAALLHHGRTLSAA